MMKGSAEISNCCLWTLRFWLYSSILLIYGCSGENRTEQQSDRASIIFSDNDTTVLSLITSSSNRTPVHAPHFCEVVKDEVESLLRAKDKNGEYILQKKDGTPYNMYDDELKIYTTLNLPMQNAAQSAIRKHHSTNLQPAFTKNNGSGDFSPFSKTFNGQAVSNEEVLKVLAQRRMESERYRKLKATGWSEKEIEGNFRSPTRMKLFSWGGVIDTVLSPNDSIRYVLNYIQSGMISMEPATGNVKAWVGSINYAYFPEDFTMSHKPQMGVLIRPFIYASALTMKVITPCTEFTDNDYCVELLSSGGKRWCPQGRKTDNVKNSFTYSGGSIVPIISRMGAVGPQTCVKFLGTMDINVPDELISPTVCLGTPNASLFEVITAYSMFANDGVYQRPHLIRRIEDKNGNEMYASQTAGRRVLDPIVAFDVLQLMKDCVNSGTATSLKWSEKWGGITAPTAAFSGTSQSNVDGWFVGIIPGLVTGIWSGGQEKQVRFRSMTWGQGARMSLPIYGYYMKDLSKNTELAIGKADFKPPKGYDQKRFDCAN